MIRRHHWRYSDRQIDRYYVNDRPRRARCAVTRIPFHPVHKVMYLGYTLPTAGQIESIDLIPPDRATDCPLPDPKVYRYFPRLSLRAC
jgi:hypothetical protein